MTMKQDPHRRVFWFGPAEVRMPTDGRHWPDPLTAARNAPNGAHLWSAYHSAPRGHAERLTRADTDKIMQAIAERALLALPPAERGQFFEVEPVDVIVRACRMRAESEGPRTMAPDARADLVWRTWHEHLAHFAKVSRVLATTEFAKRVAA